MLLYLIVACEIGFWVLIVAGLTTRYVLRRPRLGGALLLAVPVVDLVLLVATGLSLREGDTADLSHGLAAVYLGFTVAFGHRVIHTADVQFAHRFAGGPAPRPLPAAGPARVDHEWRTWLRVLLACGLASLLLAGGIALVGEAARTAELGEWIERMGVVVLVALAWPLAAVAAARRARTI